jgi:hypothetical protein
MVKETELSISHSLEGHSLASGTPLKPVFDGMGVPDNELGHHGNAGKRMGATNLASGDGDHSHGHDEHGHHQGMPSVFTANPADQGALWESGPQVLDTTPPLAKHLEQATEQQVEDFYFQFYRPFYLFHEQVRVSCVPHLLLLRARTS